jgi:hypothetical protein
MTAAIPPACCAGADHGKPHPPLRRIGRADRGHFACAGADDHIARLGARLLRPYLSGPDTDADTDADADLHTNLDAVSDTGAGRVALAHPFAFSVAVTFTKSISDSDIDTKPDADPNANPDANHYRRR